VGCADPPTKFALITRTKARGLQSCCASIAGHWKTA
jgi:hypothetical protein